MPIALRESFATACEKLGEKAGKNNRNVAVCSSSTAVDLSDACFAGVGYVLKCKEECYSYCKVKRKSCFLPY